MKFIAHLFATLALVICVQSMPVAAQDAEPTVPATTESQADENDVFVAPVVIEGETLFNVRGSSVLPAAERAAKVEERIYAVTELPQNAPLHFEVRQNEFGLAVFANSRMITVVTETDAEYEQFEIDTLAQLQAEAIEAAVRNYWLGRSNEARVDSALGAVGWTVGFLIVTLLFFKRRDKLNRAVARLTERQFTQVEEATKSIVRGEAVARLASFGSNVVLWVIYLFILYYYLSVVLLSFAETRPFAQILLDYVSEPLVGIILGFLGYVPSLIMLAIIALITRYAIRGVRIILDNVEAGIFEWKNFEPHWVNPTYNIARVAIIAIAVVFAYPHIPGSDSRAFQGLTILAGIVVSLGSNTVVSNMMAGLFVVYRRSTNIGDRIKVGNQVGDVVEIKLMETLVKSIKNEMISIPNAQLLNSEVINYSRTIDGRGLLVNTTVGIGYEEPQEKIEAMLVEAANRTTHLKLSPKPFVLMTALADYAINYQINAFSTRGSSLPQIYSDLHRNIVSVFNENGVQIMTPSYIADPDEPKVPKEKWDGVLASTNE
ncbi:mechanosensitive ion channel family protein [Tateyamaria sp.]|uniref:mechanosensitive ion channel family protein n=1 Tax=Tateyamaria sp. TaxID=1929288 RepID=UPI00327B54B6